MPTTTLPTLATLVGLWTLVLLGSAAAGEEPIRGDMAPIVGDLDALLDQPLTDAQAKTLFERLHKLLQERMGEDVVSQRDLYVGAMQGMIEAVNHRQRSSASPLKAQMPPACSLLQADQATQLERGLQGKMTGVGMEFRVQPEIGSLLVTRVFDGSPGDRTGISVGDQVVTIDGSGLGGLGLGAILAMLQGGEGSPINLGLLRTQGGLRGLYSVDLLREVFAVPSTYESLQPGGVGVVHVSQLHSGTPSEVEEALTRLVKRGAERFVLDLRDNVGGNVTAAAELADLFLPPTTVLLHLVEPGLPESDLVAHREVIFPQRLVVLVNRWTAGTAEAVAMALQEHDRAYVIGERTMGNARTETLVPLGPLVVRIDSVRMQSPTGISWQGIGVVPDTNVENPLGVPLVDVDGDEEDRSLGLDPQFSTAVHYLQSDGL